LNFFADVLVGVSDFVDLVFGDVSVGVSFGSKRGKISVVVGCPRGLLYSEWLMVLDKVEAVCFERGYVGLGWRVSMCEFLCDHESRRLDGVSGLTLNDFSCGVMEKIYEKPDGGLRHERRVNGTIPVDVVTAFLCGGLPESGSLRRLEAVEAGLRELTEAVKYVNRGLADLRYDLREDSR